MNQSADGGEPRDETPAPPLPQYPATPDQAAQHPVALPVAGPDAYPGPGQGWAGPPPQAPADFPGKTLGIVGLIVAIFANVIGLILSIVALNQSKKAGFRNGPALAGVIVGSVLTGIGVLVAVISLVITLTAGFGALVAGGIAAGSGSSSSSGGSGAGPDSGTDGGTLTDAASLQIGDCILDQGGASITQVPVVDCAVPHDYEVYANVQVPDTNDGSYPGDDKMDAAADKSCYDAFAAFVGAPYESSALDYTYLMPSESSWSSGDRLVTCGIGDPSGQVTGTLEGSAR
ncbi:septum formation family protein [Herbiconiux sp. 11R-BC]|uniref:DUF4190 domain-containing protein n=1 Tax=Herbiconiux sp. 11R-BC TaxID=3111637 RepID=UPI003C107867